jgi:hypothetical protein
MSLLSTKSILLRMSVILSSSSPLGSFPAFNRSCSRRCPLQCTPSLDPSQFAHMRGVLHRRKGINLFACGLHPRSRPRRSAPVSPSSAQRAGANNSHALSGARANVSGRPRECAAPFRKRRFAPTANEQSAFSQNRFARADLC